MDRIEDKAATLLENYDLDSFPINVRKLAEELELKIIEQEFEDKVAGLLYSKENVSFIGLNANHHNNRKRFTIAHEIGHYILLHTKWTNGIHIDNKGFIFRKTNDDTQDDNKEREANRFAASVLMPESLLKKFIKKGSNTIVR